MDLPVALCSRPAVEYIPLHPEALASFPCSEPLSLEVYARPDQVAPSVKALLPDSRKETWPADRMLLICRNFMPIKAYYRGHDVVITSLPAAGTGVVAAMETGFFYKDRLFFEASLLSGESLASCRWDVPLDVAIRRPAHSPGLRSQARRLSPQPAARKDPGRTVSGAGVVGLAHNGR